MDYFCQTGDFDQPGVSIPKRFNESITVFVEKLQLKYQLVKFNDIPTLHVRYLFFDIFREESSKKGTDGNVSNC